MLFRKKKSSFLKPILLIAFVFLKIILSAQVAPEKYWIQFSNKKNNFFTVDNPELFLSERAIQRRNKQQIPIVENDLPVTSLYIDSLKSLGLTILNKSKWFNTVTVHSTDTLLLDTIQNISFIANSQKSGKIKGIKRHKNKFLNPYLTNNLNDYTGDVYDYGMSFKQIEMVNGHLLHNQGFKGQGIHIAVIDAGFYNVDSLPAFDSLWANNQILGTKDFVDGDTIVFDAHEHGMQVLSIIGGNLPGQLIGTAPMANFWLLRSEDTSSEYIIEEDNWIAAAEFADSAGVDIINTSLGYSLFDDTLQNHSYEQMDGNTTRISIGADIAASKGILVVVSAGNEGNDPWQYITAPADADSVLTVGAVDALENKTSFSSTGPTYDGRIKPNITALGKGTIIQAKDGTIKQGDGTSFSAPIITGMAACLWQAHYELINTQILQAIEKSADQYLYPDSLKGYGIPDFNKANLILSSISNQFLDNNLLKAYPNPFTDHIHIEFYPMNYHKVTIEIFDMVGKKVFFDIKTISNFSTDIYIEGLNKLSKGIYILKLYTNKKVHQLKLLKM